MGKKVTLEDLFEIVRDEYDNSFYLKVKPIFNKHRINIQTNYGRIMIDHWVKDEEVVEVESATVEDERLILNDIILEGFDKRPPEGYGRAYIIIKKNKVKKK